MRRVRWNWERRLRWVVVEVVLECMVAYMERFGECEIEGGDLGIILF